ncbi:MAG TPA: hypothetical protein PKC13_27810, partial [Blastocatellia bacterium]|nr:hypothetical protein [Blastocatellia bacterium]
MSKKKRSAYLVIILAVLSLVWSQSGTEARQQANKVSFLRDIQPIFAASCAGCHGEKKQAAGLRLDSKKVALGKVIKPG